MRVRNTDESWGLVARALHWSMAALIVFQFALGVYMTSLTDLLEQFRLIQVHKSWGFVIFALALARVAWRLANTTPAAPERAPLWQVRAAAMSHALLYTLMLALPLSGWVMVSAAPVQDLLGIDNMVFSWFALPDPWTPGVEINRSRRRGRSPRSVDCAGAAPFRARRRGNEASSGLARPGSVENDARALTVHVPLAAKSRPFHPFGRCMSRLSRTHSRRFGGE